MKIIQLIKDLFNPDSGKNEKPGLAGETAGEEKKNTPSGEESNPAKTPNYTELINGMVSAAGYTNYTPVGSTNSVCPSCGAGLENFPSRKMQCPSCGADIFVRTRDSDRKKVLLSSGQLEEFESQRIYDSGKYDRKVEKLTGDMARYASGTGRWIFLSALSENDNKEFIQLHGRLIESGSEEEAETLRLLIRPDSRARTKTWLNDPEHDPDLKEYEQQRKDWFDSRKK